VYCHQCGTQLPAGAGFCISCGTKTSSGATNIPEPQTVVSPTIDDPPSVPMKPSPVTPLRSRCATTAKSWAMLALIPSLFSSCNLLYRNGAGEFIVAVLIRFAFYWAVIFAVAYGLCRWRSK